MRAKRILENGAFSPEDVQRLQDTFDRSWSELKAETKNPVAARERLATIVVSLGNARLDLEAEELASVATRLFRAIDVDADTTP